VTTQPEHSLILAGVARSGTSWLGQIFDSSPKVRFRFQPLFSYAFQGRVTSESSDAEINQFLGDLFEYEDDFLLQTDKRDSGQYPVFEKDQIQNYLVFKENRYQYLFPRFLEASEGLKMICIVRNPCAVIHSWSSNVKEFPPGADLQAEWRSGECKNQGREEEFFGFDKWKEVANLYLDLEAREPGRVRTVRYEDLVIDPQATVDSLFGFAGLPLTAQTNPYSVYKSPAVKDAWREALPVNISTEIHADLEGTRLERFLN
jgi:hypothetical protein